MEDSDTETDVCCLPLTTPCLRFGGTPQAKRPVLSARMCPTGPDLASGGLDMAHFGLERFRQSNHAPSIKFQTRFQNSKFAFHELPRRPSLLPGAPCPTCMGPHALP